MWFFSKKPKPVSRPQVHELVVDESHPLKDASDYLIKVGISHFEGDPEKCRVYFMLSQPHWQDLMVYPRQHSIPRESAIELAHVWAHALRTTHSVGQKFYESDIK